MHMDRGIYEWVYVCVCLCVCGTGGRLTQTDVRNEAKRVGSRGKCERETQSGDTLQQNVEHECCPLLTTYLACTAAFLPTPSLPCHSHTHTQTPTHTHNPRY
ncbi:hypothetical protein AMECASPLE_029058 [Ameca splendens]|uniref:Secreted protein n=1 Tax=Ameca splendens TaxID=208324 RepID=A0ABV0XUV6_9TELE